MDAEKLKECFAAIEKGDTEYVAQCFKIIYGNDRFHDSSNHLIYTATHYEKYEIVKQVLGKDTQVYYEQEGETALMAASKKGNEKLVTLLLQGGANPNSHRHDGQTALMFAAQKGHSEVAEILLQYGANVDMQDSDGRSALMFSVKEGHTATTEVLLKWNADPDLQSFNWESPMSLSLQQGYPMEECHRYSPKTPPTALRANWVFCMQQGDPMEECLPLKKTLFLLLSVPSHTVGVIITTSILILFLILMSKIITYLQLKFKSKASIRDVTFCMAKLVLLKWTNEKGELQKFRLVKKVSSKWREFGYIFKLEEDLLEAIKLECLGDCRTCWYKVMEEWLEEGGTSEYPATWEGLVTVLEDVEYETVARELERVLPCCQAN